MMRRIIYYMVSSLILALFLVSCAGEAVPIIEMTKAKVAISKAERYKAPQFAPDKYNKAIELIERSHDYVKDSDLDRARRRADRARRAAEEAIVAAAPRMVEDAIASARESIRRAEVVNAEVFAEDEYQDAQMELRNAELKMEQDEYDPAIESAESADGTAQQAYSISMGKKQLIRDAIMEVRQTLVTAQEYGAEEIQPDTFEAAKSHLGEAVDTYRSDKLKESYKSVQDAKELADEVFSIVIEEASEQNLARARNSYDQAEASPNASAAQDELQAASEMLETARSQHSDGQYRESIDSSDESIRLSTLVLGAEPAEQEEPDVSDGLAETDEYWVYTVPNRSGRPKECLRSIADRFYSDEMKWPYIYDANRDTIQNPDLIYPGWDLKVPKWDQPGGPESTAEAAPESGQRTDDSYDESMDSDDNAEDPMEDDDFEEEDAPAAEEDAPAVEGEAPESSSDDTVEVVPDN